MTKRGWIATAASVMTCLSATAMAAPKDGFASPKALAAAYVAAVAAEDLDAVKAVYAEPVDSFLSQGGIAKSRTEIAAEWAKLFKAFDHIVMHTDEVGAVRSGNLRSSWGNWGMKARRADNGEAVEWIGTYMDVSIKTRQGWKYRADLAPMTMKKPVPAK